MWRREAHPAVWEGWEAHPEVLLGSGGTHRGTGKVRRSTQRSAKGREAHPEVGEELRIPPGGLGGA